MIDKLFIPKTILKGIADSIRAKTTDTNSIKVKNMPTAIRNIPSGEGAKINTNINNLTLREENLNNILKGVLNSQFLEKDSIGSNVEIKGPVNQATIKIEGKNRTSDYQYITDTNTDAVGDFNAIVPNYYEYKISFNGTENINASENYLREGYIRFLVSPGSRGGLYSTALQVGENLRVYDGEGSLIPNNNGEISLDFDEDKEFIYKGVINHLNGNYDQVKEVEIFTNIEDINEEINLHYNNNIQSIMFKEPCTVKDLFLGYGIDSCDNLKVVRLPHSIKRIMDGAFNECPVLEYINIPGINTIINGEQILGNNNLITFELESGFDLNVTHMTFGFYSNYDNRLQHLILAGEPLYKEIKYLNYNESWINIRGHNYERRVSFQPDTYRVLENSVSELDNVNYINFPIMLNKIDNNAFNGLSNSKNTVLRFEGYVPPQLGENNHPEDVFNLSGSLNIPYKVICPDVAHDAYFERFSSSSDFEVLYRDDDINPSEDDGGEFSVTIRGKTLESNGDFLGLLYNNEAYYYLDNVLVEQYPGVKAIYNGDALDFTFDDYGVHSFTATGGIKTIENNAFKDNQEIIKFRFSYSTISIGENAFNNCCNLQTLIFRDNCPGIGENAFTGLHPDCTVYVPSDFVESYENSVLGGYNIVAYPTQNLVVDKISSYLYETKDDVDLDYESAKSHFEDEKPEE